MPESEAPSDPLEAEGKQLSWPGIQRDMERGREINRLGGHTEGVGIWGEYALMRLRLQ